MPLFFFWQFCKLSTQIRQSNCPARHPKQQGAISHNRNIAIKIQLFKFIITIGFSSHDMSWRPISETRITPRINNQHMPVNPDLTNTVYAPRIQPKIQPTLWKEDLTYFTLWIQFVRLAPRSTNMCRQCRLITTLWCAATNRSKLNCHRVSLVFPGKETFSSLFGHWIIQLAANVTT